MNLTQYLNEVNNARNRNLGDVMAALLSYRDYHAQSPKLKGIRVDNISFRNLVEPFEEVISQHFLCLDALDEGDAYLAFQHQYALVQNFTKIFTLTQDQNWMLKIVQTVCLELRLLAGKADAAARNPKNPVECMEKAAEGLMGCFRICAADNRASEQNTKKWGMLFLANQMFKVYFKINRHYLCKPLVRAIQSCPLKDKFSLAQRITYKYFAGQREMFDGLYSNAEESLTFCFANCHIQSKKNKRSILIYLIPVKMMQGVMPKRTLLEKYNLMNFWSVAEAVKQGNLAQFNQIMEDNLTFFIKHGIYIVMQKLKPIVIRNLLKKVYRIVGSHQVPVEMFLKALLMMQEDTTWDEAECLLANLIVDNIVKGYISYQHDILVVSKLNAFPKLTSTPAPVSANEGRFSNR